MSPPSHPLLPSLSPERAQRNLVSIVARAGDALGRALPQLVAQVPDPDAALNLLDRFIAAASAEVVARLVSDLSLVQALLAIFSHSLFLAETLIQNPNLLLWLDESRRLDRVKTLDELERELASFSAHSAAAERSLSLARFKRREYLRIVLRDVLGLATLAETTAELSHLADALLERAYQWAWRDLTARFGAPGASPPVLAARMPAGRRGKPSPLCAGMTVIGLGKLGGGELNYSSDIDLFFIYEQAGETAGGPGGKTTHHEFFVRLAQQITLYVSQATPEGAAYRVDLRLRPGGSEGEIALPLSRVLTYYEQQAREWEWQMLIKARHCAGTAGLARRFLAGVTDVVYRSGQNFAAIESVLQARERISAQLESGRVRGQRSQHSDVKLDPGGIRDIEFLVQCLQRVHGGGDAWLRSPNTLVAMQRLHDKGRLPSADFQLLSSAYTLLRNTEHRLQLHLGQQTHTLPGDRHSLDVLARSLGRFTAGYRGWGIGEGAADPGGTLLAEFERTMSAVQAIYERVIHQPLPRLPESDFQLQPARAGGTHTAEQLRRFEGVNPHLATVLNRAPLNRHGRGNLRRLLDSAATSATAPQALAQLDAQALEHLLQALETSDYVADALAARPHEMTAFAEPVLASDERQMGMFSSPKRALSALAERVLTGASGYRERMRLLRVLYQRRLLQLIAGELISPPRVGESLRHITHLAEDALECALRIAAAQLGRPGGEGAAAGLAVLALGRLGLHEFDIFSDVDLVFVAPPAQVASGARLAAHAIEVISAYTQEGTLFAVDARLRPSGGEGELVQSAAGLATYFEQRAGLWEVVSYLKARPIAGDPATGADAMRRLRPVLYQRLADREQLRTGLREMRQRIETELRPGMRELKTGRGGYYDLDFALSACAAQQPEIDLHGLNLAEMARRLAAGSGQPMQLEELAQLAELLRASDHCLRLASGKVARTLPEHGHASETAAKLLSRMLRRSLRGTLAGEMAEANRRIREIYGELVG